MRMLLQWIAGFYLISLSACDRENSSFSSSKKALKASPPSQSPATAENPNPPTSEASLPSTSTTIDSETIMKLKAECWFAVSGTWIGYGDHGNVFPLTKSGKPIGPSEIFDDVGGVYLSARPDPYIYGKGGKEIDNAKKYTFDSILIAPGMTAEILDIA